ncbi:MAG: hypothetical protein ACHQ1D_01190 [Nitrososphaerales archaeon]
MKLKLTYKEAMELFPIVSVRPENVVILNLIADAIMKHYKV